MKNAYRLLVLVRLDSVGEDLFVVLIMIWNTNN